MYYGYVYRTTCIPTGMKYIGKCANQKVRNYNVLDPKYFGSGSQFKKDLAKYGKKSFIVEIIQWYDTADDLRKGEEYWLTYYDVVNSNEYYNRTLTSCGWRTDPPWNKGQHGVQDFTQAQLDALEYGRHLPASEKLKDKLRHRDTLVEYTPEYRKKLSDAALKYESTHEYVYMINLGGKRKRVMVEDIDKKLQLGWKQMLVKKNRHKKLESSTTNR